MRSPVPFCFRHPLFCTFPLASFFFAAFFVFPLHSVLAQVEVSHGLRIDGTVNVVRRDSTRLYFGGNFWDVGYAANNLAQFKPNSNIPSLGFPQTNGTVHCIVDDGFGGWYVGGSFSRVGLHPRSNLFRVFSSGKLDPDFTPQFDGEVRCIYVDSNRLYVGGRFNKINGIVRPKCVALDPAKGNVINDFNLSFEENLTSVLKALDKRDSILYLGGWFFTVAGSSQAMFAAYNLRSGRVTSSMGFQDSVNAVVATDTSLYIGGRFLTVGQSSSSFAVLDKQTDSLRPVADGLQGFIYDMCPDGSGGFFVAGNLKNYGGRTVSSIFRVRSDFSLDTTFTPPAGTSEWVTSLARSGDTLYYSELVNVVISPGTSLIESNDSRVSALRISSAQRLPDISISLQGLRRFGQSRYGANRLVVLPKYLVAAGLFDLVDSLWQPNLAVIDRANHRVLLNSPAAWSEVTSLAAKDDSIFVAGQEAGFVAKPRWRMALFRRNGTADTTWRYVNKGGRAFPETEKIFDIGDAFVIDDASGSGLTYGEHNRTLLKVSNSGVLDTSFRLVTRQNMPVYGSFSKVERSAADLYCSGYFFLPDGRKTGMIKCSAVTGVLDTLFDCAVVDSTYAWGTVVSPVTDFVLADTSVYLTMSSSANSVSYLPFAARGLVRLHRTFGTWLPAPSLFLQTSQISSLDPIRLASVDTNIYLAGQFTSTGYLSEGFAKLDGEREPDLQVPSFRALGAMSVRSLARDQQGRWYVAGRFDHVVPGGGGRANIVRLHPDFRLDTTFVVSVNSTVNALAIRDTTLVIGGLFSIVNGQTRIALAAISINSGALTSFPGSVAGVVSSLAFRGDTLLVGGAFNRVNGAFCRNFAALSLSSGTAYQMAGTSGDVGRIVVSGDTLHVMGGFRHAGYDRSAFVRFDGMSNTPLAALAQVVGTVNAVARDSAGFWYLGGNFTSVGGLNRSNIARIRPTGIVDSTWSASVNGAVRSIVLSGTRLYVGGSFSTVNGNARNNIAAIDSPTSLLVATFAPSINGEVTDMFVRGDSLFASGNFTQVAGRDQPRLAILSTADASLILSPAADGIVNDIEHDSTGTLYMGGRFTTVGYRTGAWSVLDSATALPRTLSAYTDGEIVTALSDGAGGWYVAGSFTTIGGVTRNNVARISSTGAVTSFNPNTNGRVNTLAIDGTGLVLGGAFTTVGGQTRNRLARVDATTGAVAPWNPNCNGEVFSILRSGDSLFVGGAFTTINAVTRNRLAKTALASVSISAFNPNVNGLVRTSRLHQGRLYVGGDFTDIAGTTRNRIAALDTLTGVATAFNPNAGASVFTMLPLGDTLLIGGDFETVSGQTRTRIASVSTTTGAPFAFAPTVDSTIRALSVAGATLYAGGDFTAVNGGSRTRAAAWTYPELSLTSWDPVASGRINTIVQAGASTILGGAQDFVQWVSRQNAAAITLASRAVQSWNPSPNDSVNSVVLRSGTIYLGGAFTQVSGQARNRVCAVEASTGNLGALSIQLNNSVRSLLVRDTVLVIGGRFTASEQIPVPSLVGVGLQGGAVVWSPGANAQVNVLRLFGNEVAAGGAFVVSPVSLGQFYAAINARTGLSMNHGLNFNDTVSALVLRGDSAYFGGSFTSVNGQPRNRLCVAKLSGVLGTFNPSMNGPIRTLLLRQSELVAGGAFTSAGNQSRIGIAGFDPSSGAINSRRNDLGTSNGLTGAGGVLALAEANPSLVAVGDFSVACPEQRGGFGHFSTKSNQFFDSPTTSILPFNFREVLQYVGMVSALAIRDSILYIGGRFDTIQGAFRKNLAALNIRTGSLTDFSSPVNKFSEQVFTTPHINALALDSTTLYVGGDFDWVGTQRRAYATSLIRSSGQPGSWRPNPNGPVKGIVLRHDSVICAGRFELIAGTTVDTLITSHWPSLAKVTLSSFSLDTLAMRSTNVGIADLSVSPNGVVAFGNISATSRALEFDFGAGTTRLFFDTVTGGVNTGAVYDGKAIYGGGFTTVRGQERRNLAMLNLSNLGLLPWNPGAGGEVRRIIDLGDKLAVIGDELATVNTIPRRGLVELNRQGTVVKGADVQFNGEVNTLLLNSSGVIAGGGFTSVRGNQRRRVAQLTFQGTLTSFNPDMSSTVHTLGQRGDTVVIGGAFSSVGGALSRANLAFARISDNAILPWNPGPGGAVHATKYDSRGLLVGGGFSATGVVSRSDLFAYDIDTREILPWNPTFDASATVMALHVSGSNIYAGGAFSTVNGQSRSNIAQFQKASGSLNSWTANTNNTVRAIARRNNRVFLGGDFTFVSSQVRERLAEVSEASGTPTSFEPRPNASVRSLLVDGDSLYFGGGFSSVGGNARGRGGMVNLLNNSLTPWNPLANDTIRTMAAQAGNILIGGDFTTIAGSDRRRFASVTKAGAVLNPLVLNSNARINAITVQGTTAYLGGEFTTVGDSSRLRLAAVDISNGRLTSFKPAIRGDSAPGISVQSIAGNSGDLFVGGSFRNIDSIAVVQNGAGIGNCTGSVSIWKPAQICFGDSVTLRFWHEGFVPPLSWQWRNGLTNDLLGTDSTLKLEANMPVSILLTLSDSGGCSRSDQVLVYPRPGPSVFALSSSSNNTCVGDSITISLSGSETGILYQLKRNSTDLGSPQVGTGSALTFHVASINAGRSAFTVIASSNDLPCPRTMRDSVVVTRSPNVTSFTPATGSSGTVVTITGRYFTGATAVSFGGVAAQSFTVLNDSVISATVGSGAAGKVRVTVGSCFGESATDFTIDATDITVRAYMQNLYSGGVHQVVPAMVELWSGSDLSSATLAHRAAGTVNTAGEVKVSIQGLVTGQYWIVYRYASHLAVASSARVTITAGTPLTYDFTDAASKALGFESTVNIGGAFHLRGGDPDGNADINGTDYGSVTTNFGQSTSVPAATLGSAGTGSPVTAVTVTSYMQNYFSGGVHRVSSAMLELRSGVDLDASTLVAQQSVVLGTNGQATAHFAGLASGLYWIVVRHGAHLAVASANRLSVTAGTPVSYNFSDAANRAFGFQTTVLSGGVYLIRCGDSNGDGDVSGTDYSPVTTNFGRSAVVPEP